VERSLRKRLSDKLLNAGATMAIDRQTMYREYMRSGVKALSPADAQLLSALGITSACMIRLGMFIMPSGSGLF
jgi:hypothetical protein